MRSRCMSLLPRTTLHSDSEQFIYYWMLEGDLGLDWGNRKEPNGRAEKRTTLTVVLVQGLAKRLRKQRALLCKPRALLCKPSRDEDSRKLTLTVVLDQGLAKKAQETKGIVMQTKSWWGFTQTNPDSRVGSRSSKKGSGNKGHCYANQGHCYANRTDIYGNRILRL